MSEESYHENVRLGVTGIGTPTCMPASLDRISRLYEVSTPTYRYYAYAAQRFIDVAGNNPTLITKDLALMGRVARSLIFQDLGVESRQDIVTERADTVAELEDALADLSLDGYRIGVNLDIDGLHMVGLQAVDRKHYYAKSNTSPFEDDYPVHVDDIYDYLDLSPPFKIKGDSKEGVSKNIIALPPEPRR